ncbi:MAG: hypothetical protein IT222_12035 [Crocinitomix sp.]|nr:hypothetical protein [Crocinitomix sp.]
MSIGDERLDQLFDCAREQRPIANYEETKQAFISATLVAAGGVLATNGLLKLLTLKKWIIMISTLSIITTGALILGFHLNAQNQLQDDEKTTTSTTLETEKPIFPKQITDIFPIDKSSSLIQVANNQANIEEKAVEDLYKVEEIKKEEFPVNTLATQNFFPQKNLLTLSPTEAITPYSERFDITQKTTIEELEEIKKRAAESGVQLDYKARYKNNKITEINFSIRVKQGTDTYTQYMNANMTTTDNFSYTIAWKHSEDGQVIDLFWGDTEEFEAQEHTQVTNDDVDWTELRKEIIDVQSTLFADTSELRVKLEAELAQLTSEMERVIAEYDREEIDVLMREISTRADDLIGLINLEIDLIDQVELEMEAAQLEMENAMMEADEAFKEARGAKKEAKNAQKSAEKEQEKNAK